MSRNAALKAQYPRIDDPVAAINFALGKARVGNDYELRDFLETWRDGAWDEIEQTYPEFLAQVRS